MTIFFIQKELHFTVTEILKMINMRKHVALFAIEEKSFLHCTKKDYEKTDNKKLKKYLFSIDEEDLDCAKILLDIVLQQDANYDIIQSGLNIIARQHESKKHTHRNNS
jgi:hypothetical protein